VTPPSLNILAHYALLFFLWETEAGESESMEEGMLL
jgi:hypothetical protein